MHKSALISSPGAITLILGLLLLLWGFFPQQESQKSIEIPGFGVQNIYWTPSIRFGDKGQLTLEFIRSDLGDIDPVNIKSEGDEMIGKSDVLLVESRLELWSAIIEPGPEVLLTIGKGDKQAVTWNIEPSKTGRYKPELWVYLHQPVDGEGTTDKQPISIQDLELTSISLFGLSGPIARMSGIISCLVAIIYFMSYVSDFQRINSILIKPG